MYRDAQQHAARLQAELDAINAAAPKAAGTGEPLYTAAARELVSQLTRDIELYSREARDYETSGLAKADRQLDERRQEKQRRADLSKRNALIERERLAAISAIDAEIAGYVWFAGKNLSASDKRQLTAEHRARVAAVQNHNALMQTALDSPDILAEAAAEHGISLDTVRLSLQRTLDTGMIESRATIGGETYIIRTWADGNTSILPAYGE